jgi:hypothetical protein
MSPTNEDYADEADRPTTVVERVAIVSREVVGASERMPVRVVVLFVIALACVILAQVPFNVVGGAAIVLLALDTATHRR